MTVYVSLLELSDPFIFGVYRLFSSQFASYPLYFRKAMSVRECHLVLFICTLRNYFMRKNVSGQITQI